MKKEIVLAAVLCDSGGMWWGGKHCKWDRTNYVPTHIFRIDRKRINKRETSHVGKKSLSAAHGKKLSEYREKSIDPSKYFGSVVGKYCLYLLIVHVWITFFSGLHWNHFYSHGNVMLIVNVLDGTK